MSTCCRRERHSYTMRLRVLLAGRDCCEDDLPSLLPPLPEASSEAALAPLALLLVREEELAERLPHAEPLFPKTSLSYLEGISIDI